MIAEAGDPATVNSTHQEEPSVPCVKCGKLFRTARGALQHQRQCKIVTDIESSYHQKQKQNQNRNLKTTTSEAQRDFTGEISKGLTLRD